MYVFRLTNYLSDDFAFLDLTEVVWAFTDQLCEFFDDEETCFELQQTAESGEEP